MTLVIPLKAKDGVALQDFYDYWLNAHVTLPPRFPGISSVWLHKTSLADSLWPAVDGVSMRPDEEDTFDGVPEATFPTMDDLQAFIKASRVQMEDGINFLSQEIGYAGLGPNSTTVRDTTDPAPDGTDTHVRHLVFLRKRPEVSVADFRSWVDDALVPALAASDEVLKLRRHLFEELDITLDHPGVTMTKPMERQYQAMVEVVVGDEAAFARFVESAEYAAAAAELAKCAAVHPARVQRCITTKHDGRITLAGCVAWPSPTHPQARRGQPDPRRRLPRVPAARRPGALGLEHLVPLAYPVGPDHAVLQEGVVGHERVDGLAGGEDGHGADGLVGERAYEQQLTALVELVEAGPVGRVVLHRERLGTLGELVGHDVLHAGPPGTAAASAARMRAQPVAKAPAA